MNPLGKQSSLNDKFDMCEIARARVLILFLRRDDGRMSLGEDLSDIDAVSLTTSWTVTGAKMSTDELGTCHCIGATMDAAGRKQRRSEIVIMILDTFDMKKIAQAVCQTAKFIVSKRHSLF